MVFVALILDVGRHGRIEIMVTREDIGELGERELDETDAQLANIKRITGIVALCVPVVLTVWFIARYSTAMPLTDEWFFLRAAIVLKEIDLFSFANLGKIFKLLPYQIYDHHVIVPFMLYLPISEVSNFDNRALLLVTLAVWGIVLAIFRSILGSTAWTIPIAFVLFNPGRFVELLWGFEFVVALSVLFPVLGLVVLSRIDPDDSAARLLSKAAGATALIIAGTLSTAGGFFGFVGAAAYLAARRLPLRQTLLLAELLLVATFVVYFAVMSGSSHAPALTLRNILFILTGFGATIFGMPVDIKSFSVDLLSLTGLALVASMGAAVILAARGGFLSRLALPIGLFMFGLSTMAGIAIGRPTLANWHLEYALPAVCAAYAASYLVYRELPSRQTTLMFAGTGLILMLSPIAFYNAFTQYGPDYNSYIRSIEQYARSYLANPSQQKPFPATGGWDLNADMVWFLASRNHLVFADENRALLSAARTPIPAGKMVLATDDINGSRRPHVRLVASAPKDTKADAIVLVMGGRELILRKTDPRVVAPVMCDEPCFTGWLSAFDTPEGVATAQWNAVSLARGG